MWFCTPKEFDYFQAEAELNPGMKLKMADPFYGNADLYTRRNLLDMNAIEA